MKPESEACRIGEHIDGCKGCSCPCHPRHGRPAEVWPGAPKPQTAVRGATSSPTAY